MDIIIKSRGHGKTVDLIRMSSETSIPIATHTPNHIQFLANEMDLIIPKPISYREINQFDRVYIDDLDIYLKSIGCHCEAFTVTLDD